MKNKFYGRISIILALLLLFSTFALGCGNDNELKEGRDYIISQQYDYNLPNKIVYDFLGDDVMPMIAYEAPSERSYMYSGTKFEPTQNDKVYSDIVDAGINILLHRFNYREAKDEILRSLDFAAKYGVGIYVTDPRLFEIKGGVGKDKSDTSEIYVDQEEFTQKLSEYANHKGFAGLYIRDEPSTPMFNSIGKVSTMYNNALKELNIKNKAPHVNCFPMPFIQNREGYDYMNHLRDCINIGKMDYLSFDYYPFDYNSIKDDLVPGFFTSLGAVYAVAQELNVPYMAFVQLGGNWFNTWDDHSGTKPPTINQVVWEANTFIAYGAKALEWFTCCNPPTFFQYLQSDGQTGMFDPFGNKGKYYYATKLVNDNISAIDHILVNANHHGVISTGEIMGGGSITHGLIRDKKFRQLVGVNEDSTSLIGCFDYFGKTALFVMNSSFYDNTTINLSFDDKYLYNVTQRGITNQVAGKNLTLKLAPGEGAMVVLE